MCAVHCALRNWEDSCERSVKHGSPTSQPRYCRANHRDRSSIISWTCPRTATYYIRVHGSEYLGDGFVLNVTAPELPLTDVHMRKPTPMNQCRNMSQLRAWAGLAQGAGGVPKVFHVCKATPQQLGRLQISGEAAVVGLRRGAPLVGPLRPPPLCLAVAG